MKILSNLLTIFCILVLTSSCEEKEEENSMRMDVGESRTITIDSKLLWNASDIKVETGEIYSLTSQGSWTDLNNVTDADGYNDATLDNFSSLKRDTTAKWFELVVGVNKTVLYRVGANNTLSFNETGELFFFANDADDFYDNNSGSISTTVTREQ